MRTDILRSGERQVGATLAEIRRDHVARYAWAVEIAADAATFIDVGCGVGYGCKMLADAGGRVVGIDNSEAAIAFAKEHFGDDEMILYAVRDALTLEDIQADCAICFEFIEHVSDPAAVLAELHCDRLLASVPNEAKFPFESLQNKNYHIRHYTKEEFEALLNSAGWTVRAWYTQSEPDGPGAAVRAGHDGWTLIADAVRA